MSLQKEQLLRKKTARLEKELAGRKRELQVETALEKVRAIALSMKEPAAMLNVCSVIAIQLEKLGVAAIRNVQTAIFYDDKGTYMNYEYYAKHKKKITTETSYTNHKIHKAFATKMLKGKGGFFTTHIKGKKVKEWIAYQKTTNVFIDKYLEKASSINYYWYSLGPVALGISTYDPLSREDTQLFNRFRNVFELCYRRYKDIEQAIAQAREAQLETSLEKVRAQAMSIRKSEELAGVGEIIFTELKTLGFADIRNTEIIINNDRENTITSYYYSDYGVTGTIEVDTTTHPTIKQWMEELKKTSDSFVAVHISEKEMKEWRKYRESLGYQPDHKLNKVKTVEYYSYSIGPGALSVSSFKLITEEQLKILERFKNVFGLAYRRYADVAQAETQAREAQIELALERVRARTMAMQHSNELQEAASLLFQQVKALGIPALTCGYNIWEPGEQTCTAWMSSEDGLIQPSFRIPLTESPTFIRFNKSRQNNENFYIEQVKGSALAAHYKYMLTLPVFGDTLAGFIKAGFALPTFQINHVVNFSHGNLIFISYEPVPEAWDIFKRFGKVFEQTYTRFLDLQKAEVQAREAQIELALERVRARTMAMQKSDELDDVAAILFKQVSELGIRALTTGFNVWSDDNNFYTDYVTSPHGNVINTIDATRFSVFREVSEAKKNGVDFFVQFLNGDLLKKTYIKLIAFDDEKQYEKMLQDGLQFPSQQYNHFVFGSRVSLMFITYEPVPEAHDIFKRFGKVFDQTYTRFLDLQKAEAQSREAQTELALERVRARTMAMQKSDELTDVAAILFKLVGELGIKAWTTGFNVWSDDNNFYTDYVTSPLGNVIKAYKIDATKFSVFREVSDAKKNGIEFLVQYVEGELLNETYRQLSSFGDEKQYEKMLEDGFQFPPHQYDHFVFGSKVSLMFITYEPVPEAHDIFKRFGKVFEQTYTRFLDLQKAEAQARESQIQLALERARTQSMIMQYSTELDDTLRVFHEQVLQLGIKSAFSFLWLPDEKQDRHIFWAAWAENNASTFKSKAIDYPLDRNEPATAQCLIDWKSKEPVVAYHVPPPSVKDYFAAWSELIAGVEELKPSNFSDGLYYVEAFMKYGCFGVIVKQDLRDDEKKILARFAIEFERAYTRFLDLQKAEVQAKEAQIEAALEKVRSSSLAMHKSEELEAVVAAVFDKLTELNVGFDGGVGIYVLPEETRDSFIWVAAPNHFSSPQCLQLPYDENKFFNNPILSDLWTAKEKGIDFYVRGYALEEKNFYFNYLFEYNDEQHMPAEIRKNILAAASYTHSVALVKNSAVVVNSWTGHLLSEDENQILKRFARVFEQAYTRFLDLQKAEAQSKESQIQLALERVRARTMAMQQSNELPDAANILFQQMQSLGMPTWSAGYCIWDDDHQAITLWMSSLGIIQKPFRAPVNEDPVFINIYEAWKRSETFYVESIGGEAIIEHYKYMRRLPVVGEMLDQLIADGGSLPAFQIFHLAFFSQGFLLFITYEPVPESHDIFKRFGNVFEQTYTRFLDLKKAEAQAREAKIEASLERVRSGTMAMHKSDELLQVVTVLADQLALLGFKFDNVSFGENNQDDDFKFWFIAAGQPEPLLIQVPYTDNPAPNRVKQAQQQGLKFFTDVLSQEENRQWTQHIIDHTAVKLFPDHVKNYILNCDGYARSTSILKNISLYIGNYKAIPYTAEENNLFQRFAQVFEQSYTRFLDLQKAEAQAREAQIEAALEKVRSRSLAMHHSNELSEVVSVVFDRLKELDFLMDEAAAIIITFIEDSKDHIQWIADPSQSYAIFFRTPHTDHPISSDLFNAKERGMDFFSKIYGFEEKNNYFHYLFNHSDYKNLPDAVKEMILASKDYGFSVAFEKKSAILIPTNNGKLVSGSEIDILKRFVKAFEQTYTRFLDLQKAEAQAREAQIEASLERVRSKTMAMHNSHDVGETVATMFDELVKLGITTNRCGILIHSDSPNTEVWTAKANANGEATLIIGELDTMIHPMLQLVRNAWKNKQSFFEYKLEGNDLIKYYKSINDSKYYPTQFNLDKLPSVEFHSDFYFTEGSIFAFTAKALPAESSQVFKKFAAVFGQTYRRYLDLKKAESQAREAQIEAVMEKVRARSLAMQKPSELKEVTELLRKEMGALGVEELETSSIYIVDEKNNQAECWFAIKDIREANKTLASDYMTIHLPETWVGREMLKFYHSNENQTSILMQGENRKEWIDYCAKYSTVLQHGYYGDTIPERTYHLLKFSNGYMGAASPGNISKESWDLLRRAAAAFSFAYTRFQDLQNAEARARESQIELALERVRARTMAMFKSDELADTASVVFQQLINQGIEPNRLYIGIVNSDTGDMEMWATDEDGTSVEQKFTFNYRENDSVNKMYQGWLAKKKSIVVDMQGEELENYFHYLNNIMHIPFKEGLTQKRRVQSIAFFGKGFIGMASPDEQSPQTIQLLERFAAVFDLTYTRFNDLKQAEAQAKEATIEAALEKVRGKAMAMHNSNDLSVTASMVFTELRKLGINPIRCGVGLLKKESRRAQLYSATSSVNGDNLSLVGWVQLENHPVMEKIYDSWLLQVDYFPELKGKQLKSYYERLLSGLAITVPDTTDDQIQYGHFLPASIGCLYAWSGKPYNEDEIKILKRFASIIDLTFRRYIELQKSEANAREAVRQAALDRVRADIASMRTTNDLERITPLIWNELTIIGIPFIRCGVFLMDDAQQLIHTFLSTPEGKAIAAFHIPYTTPGNIEQVLHHWQQKENYIDHWDESSFKTFADTLVKQGALDSPEQYLQTIPQGGFYLHFLPFLQGMLYVGNSTKLRDEEIQLIQSVASAFSTAYARYEDFNKLEAAKQTVEKTLTDLKQAQQQLVQSEKMASLGELTAGIAHEIQNPLNFVNNFSEVNKELIIELVEEVEKGNTNEVKALANDIKENEEKINQHGKRADAIVKGMLQHSRSTSASKEPTDINKLADEYLRLAYHGLRAKDKTFNATLNTDYDSSLSADEAGIGNINIIPQDIGRVILNLITNAFYAVTEKKKSQPDYEPVVTVSTKGPLSFGEGRGEVQIKVEDNGSGIPKNIIDKIFQPFFTTKPTGQGTGLGLSLAYDIVKAHGGELKVETKEGEGSIFIIQLPVV